MGSILLLVLMFFLNAYGQVKEINKKIAKMWEYYEQSRFINMEKLSRETLNQSLKENYTKGVAEGY